MKLLEKRCSSREMKIIKDQIEAYGQARGLNEALFVELRKAYEGAYDRAYKAFRKSDHRYPWEFWAIQYGLINTKQYTHQGEITPR